MSENYCHTPFLFFQITMAQSLQDLLDELDCSLCMESFTKPKVLPYGHWNVRKYSKSLGNKYKNRFSCPLFKAIPLFPFKVPKIPHTIMWHTIWFKLVGFNDAFNTRLYKRQGRLHTAVLSGNHMTKSGVLIKLKRHTRKGLSV